MSLIDDALRRAQAAQTPGTGAGSVLRVPMPLPDPGRYRRRHLRRLAAAALLAAVAGAVFVLRRPTPRMAPPKSQESSGSAALAAAAVRALSRTPTPTATVTATASAPAAGDRTSAAATPAPGPMMQQTPVGPRVPAAATGPAEEQAPGSASLDGAPPAAPPARREPRARTPVILPPIEVSNASGSPRVSEEERPRPAPAPSADRKPASRTRTYGGTANLPTGKLELEGIVFSETNPTALINGRVVAPGGYVEGYTVVKIGPDRVELTDDKTTIVLTLK